MVSKLLVVALAGLALAAPSSSLKVARAPCLSADFSMAMRIGVGADAPFVSLTAIDSGHPGTLNIVGEKLARYRGTPVSQNGVSPNASLAFHVKPSDDCESTQTGKFGISVPDLGENYGLSVPVTASKHTSYPHFSVNDGQIWPQLTAASQQWYACNITVQGWDYWGLSWGVYNSNGSSPFGCVPTTVIQNFNIPCFF